MEFPVLGEFIGFTGINPDILPEKLPPEDASLYVTDADNILLKNGMAEKLRGTDYLNDISTQQGIADYRPIIGLDIYRKYSTGDKYLMAATPKRLYILEDDTAWTSIATITDGDLDSIFTCANMDDKFIFVISDDGTIGYWDGEDSGSLLGESPTLKARFIVPYKTNLILLRTIESNVENYQRIWVSDPGAIATFNDDFKLDIASSGVIMGGLAMGDGINIYMDDGIYRVSYSGTDYGWIAVKISGGGGLLCPKTLCGTNDVHYFMSKEGWMKLVEGGVPTSLSYGKFNSLILDKIDPVYYARAVARFYPHLNLLFMAYPKSGSTRNDTQIIFDTNAGELVSKKALVSEHYSAYGSFEKDLSSFPADVRKLYGLSDVPIFGNSDGYIKEQKITSYADGSTPYASSVVLAPTSWKERSYNKRVLRTDLLIEKLTNENITFTLELANEANQNFLYTYTVTGAGNQGTRRFEVNDIDCFGKDFLVKIRDSGNMYGWKLHGVIFRGYYTTQR